MPRGYPKQYHKFYMMLHVISGVMKNHEPTKDARMFTMPLSFSAPPVHANNQNMHWGKRARLVKALRHEAFIRARAMRLPQGQSFAVVTLHWQPSTKRNRDAHNLVPCVKPLVDGLVDHGLVPDDNTRFMSVPEPVIHPPIKGDARMWLTVETTM